MTAAVLDAPPLLPQAGCRCACAGCRPAGSEIPVHCGSSSAGCTTAPGSLLAPARSSARHRECGGVDFHEPWCKSRALAAVLAPAIAGRGCCCTCSGCNPLTGGSHCGSWLNGCR